MNKHYLIVGVLVAIIVAGFGYQSYVTMHDGETKAEMAARLQMQADFSKSEAEKVASATPQMEMKKAETVSFISGKLMLDQDGASTPVSGDYLFQSGRKVTADGKVFNTDGTSLSLKEGQSVGGDGQVRDEQMTNTMISTNGETMMEETVMPKAGNYQAYTASLPLPSTGRIVLFFHASWCPTCKTLDTDIKAHANAIPANLTILDVDYDNSQALKVKYGVTHQHTLVQVDTHGNAIKSWSASASLSALIAELQ